MDSDKTIIKEDIVGQLKQLSDSYDELLLLIAEMDKDLQPKPQKKNTGFGRRRRGAKCEE